MGSTGQINGCPYTGDIFKISVTMHRIIKNKVLASISYSFPDSSVTIVCEFSPQKKKLLSVYLFTLFLLVYFVFLLSSRTFHQRPHRPRWPPLGGPICPRLAPRWPLRALPRTGAPPLWLLWWGPVPRPRCGGGSWPESQSGVGGGTGRGGEVCGGCPAAAPLFLAGAGAGTMDSSRDLLFSSRDLLLD